MTPVADHLPSALLEFGGAAQRQPSPTGKVPPPGDYQSWDEFLQAVETAETYWRDAEAQRGIKAMRLAPTLEVCRALLKGSPVPACELDQTWLCRYSTP